MALPGWLFGVVVAAAAVLAGPGDAWAQQDRRQELARQMVTTMDTEATINALFETMTPMIAASAAQELRLSPSEQGRLSELLAEEFRAAAPDFVTQVVNAYANNLTEQELTDIVAFLNSPSGRALLRVEKTAEAEMERQGQAIGMRVAVQAFTRLQAERNARR
jgi:hypothetical protein